MRQQQSQLQTGLTYVYDNSVENESLKLLYRTVDGVVLLKNTQTICRSEQNHS